jgi:SRSO17 transposase
MRNLQESAPQRIRDKGQQHLPGDEAWLVGEHRASGDKKYYLANLPAETNLRTLATTIKARWVCEQAHQQMKEELGLDHFEGQRTASSAKLAGRPQRSRQPHHSTTAAMPTLPKMAQRHAA